MDTRKVRELLDKRDALDTEIAEAVGGTTPAIPVKKVLRCGNCGEEGHNTKTCKKPPVSSDQVPQISLVKTE